MKTDYTHRQFGGRSFFSPGRKSPSNTGRAAQCRTELLSWGPLSMNWGSAESFSPAPPQCDCVWFGLLFLTFLLSLGWFYIGLILLNDLHNFNECVTFHLPLPPHISLPNPCSDPPPRPLSVIPSSTWPPNPTFPTSLEKIPPSPPSHPWRPWPY